MNKNLVFVMMSMILLITTPFLTSCNNDETFTAPTTGVEDPKGSSAKITPIGGKTIYEVDPTIMAYFQHFYQMYPSSLPKGQHACGPTSYMMAAHCLAGYKDRPYQTGYPLTVTKEVEIYDAVKVINNYKVIKLPNLTSYGNSVANDGNWIKCEDQNTTERSLMKAFIQQALTNNKFVVVAVNAYDFDPWYVDNQKLYNNDMSNYDLTPSGEVRTPTNANYISTADETPDSSPNKLIGGHIIIIVRLTVNLDGTGVVEYVDPLAHSRVDSNGNSISNRKYVSYTRLLNSMAMNGLANTSYDAISIGLK